jgi:hypothetical protein
MRIAIATRPPVLAAAVLIGISLLGPAPRVTGLPPVAAAIEAPPMALAEVEVIRPPAIDAAMVIAPPASHDAMNLAAVSLLDHVDSMVSAMLRAVLAPLA